MLQKKYPLGLHWFRHDLRTIDNQALVELCMQVEQVLAVYVLNPQDLQPNEFDCKPLGVHRHRFIDQSLINLKAALAESNIQLVMLQGDPKKVITQLLQDLNIECLSIEAHYGLNEVRQVEAIKSAFPSLPIIQGHSHYLLNHDKLPFKIEQMPDVFSPFRRKVEKNLSIRENMSQLNAPLKPYAIEKRVLEKIAIYEPKAEKSSNGYQGGQSSAMARIKEYFFNSDNIAQYKETRNGLDGWDFSSRFSAFLANGNISPSYVYAQLSEYEQSRVKNDSTYWLFFELLWREFFHLQSLKQGALFFQYGGIQEKEPDNKHQADTFEQWKNGETGYDIVDACMNQLAKTGFMSNRGRQLVASCFVHELNLDWRWGAAYFEEMLIDFDVASNYGNWQYLAGVGSDPRGHRQFNLQKQTDIYDPNRRFIEAWK